MKPGPSRLAAPIAGYPVVCCAEWPRVCSPLWVQFYMLFMTGAPPRQAT